MSNCNTFEYILHFVLDYHQVNSCGEFPNISNGQIKYRGIYATVSCDEGFQLKGDETFKCDRQSGNLWSPPTRPECHPVKGMFCSTLSGQSEDLLAHRIDKQSKRKRLI